MPIISHRWQLRQRPHISCKISSTSAAILSLRTNRNSTTANWCWTTAGTTFRDLGTRTRQSCQNMIVLHCSWLFIFHPAPEFPGIPKDQFRPAQAARRQPFCWPSPDLLVPGHSLLVKSDTNNLHETCTSLSHSREILVACLWRTLKSIREISSSPSAALCDNTNSYKHKVTSWNTPEHQDLCIIAVLYCMISTENASNKFCHWFTSSPARDTTAAEHQVHMHFHLEKANSAHGFLSLRSSGDNLQPDGWVFWSSFERADFVMSDTLQLWNRHFHIYPILQYQMAHQSPNDANSGRIRQSFRVLLHQIRKGLQSPSLQECNFSIDEIILRPKVSSVSVCRNKQTKLSTPRCRIETVCGIMELVPLEIRCH